MALTGAIGMEHGQVFPFGCYMVGEVEAKRDFDKSTRDTFVQESDRETGLPLWQLEVIDADPEARDKAVRVVIAAQVQPVPPTETPGSPFRLVEFEGLTVRPYVASTASGRGKLAWSFKAMGMRAPVPAGKAVGNGRGDG
jgi:hypothetical protein